MLDEMAEEEILTYDDLRVDNCDIEITCEDCSNIFEIKNVTFKTYINL